MIRDLYVENSVGRALAGLIERRGGRAIASEVAAYFDRIMTL